MKHPKTVVYNRFSYKIQTTFTAIRKIDSKDREDLRRLFVIDRDKEVLKQMVGEPLDKNGLMEFLKEDESRILFAVSGSPALPSDEIGKLQGWIMFCAGEDVVKRAEKGLDRTLSKEKLPIFEISYAKYPGSQKGQMSYALKQALLEIARKDRVDLNKKKTKNRRIITAYISPDNISSQKLAESAGFVRLPKMIYWNKAVLAKKDYVYVLNWELLRQKAFNKEWIKKTTV